MNINKKIEIIKTSATDLIGLTLFVKNTDGDICDFTVDNIEIININQPNNTKILLKSYNWTNGIEKEIIGQKVFMTKKELDTSIISDDTSAIKKKMEDMEQKAKDLLSKQTVYFLETIDNHTEIINLYIMDLYFVTRPKWHTGRGTIVHGTDGQNGTMISIIGDRCFLTLDEAKRSLKVINNKKGG